MSMHLKPFNIQLLSITLSLLLPQTSASSVLGVGRVGGRSHHLILLRIGQELIDRGHTFTLLISVHDHDKLPPSMLDTEQAKGVKFVTFTGPMPPPLSSHGWLAIDQVQKNPIGVYGQHSMAPLYMDKPSFAMCKCQA